MVISRVAPLSVAKIAGLLYLVIGLIVGGLFSLIGLGGAMAANQDYGPLTVLFGAGAVILLPICYAIFGFLMTLIGAWLFNVAAGIVGGVEVEVK